MEAKSLHLCTHIDSGLTIKGDATLLARAFDNLLANAMKYAPTFSEINMQASRVGPIIRIDIRDQGPGIPETDLKKVIEAFYRSDSSRGAATGGYGLGLAIVDKIVKQHNGVLALANAAPTGLIATVSFSVQELV
jgi:two-component system sensor histidine kinase CpxA